MKIVNYYLTNSPCYKNNLNKIDSRYTTFQSRGPLGLMLHSVGVAQPSATVFAGIFGRSDYKSASVHAFIDANTGDILQTLPWNYRAWHCAGSGNDTHIGVEMCESKYIRYKGTGDKFDVLNSQMAKADCKRAYDAAVELFAYLCNRYKIDPIKNICSHSEGNKKGIASNHSDPEHYWRGLGMGYTMDGFRADVKKQLAGLEEIDMNVNELNKLLDEKFVAIKEQLKEANQQNYISTAESLSKMYTDTLKAAVAMATIDANKIVEERLGSNVDEIDDIPWENVRDEMRTLLDVEAIDGGTTYDVNPNDIKLPLAIVRAIVVTKRYIDLKFKQLKEELSEGSQP